MTADASQPALNRYTVLNALQMSLIDCEADEATAGELAAGEVIVMKPSDTLEHAAQLMAEHETAHAVVVDDGQPVGIVSTLDVARFAAG
jgi:CBS domain-containing protein